MDGFYTVGVFHDVNPLGERVNFRAYAYRIWYIPAWPGCCLHLVQATSGREAKRLAMVQCQENHGEQKHDA